MGPRLTLHAPGGMKIDGANRIVWPNPTEGRYLMRIQAQDGAEIEETNWSINVLKPQTPGLVVHSTWHLDFIVPPAYAE